jgi:hypothetical protein
LSCWAHIKARGAAARHPKIVRQLQRSLCGTASKVGGADCGKISILHRANIARRQLHDRLRLAREANELDVEHVLMDVHDRAQIAALEPVFREVALENDSIKFVERHAFLSG